MRAYQMIEWLLLQPDQMEILVLDRQGALCAPKFVVLPVTRGRHRVLIEPTAFIPEPSEQEALQLAPRDGRMAAAGDS